VKNVNVELRARSACSAHHSARFARSARSYSIPNEADRGHLLAHDPGAGQPLCHLCHAPAKPSPRRRTRQNKTKDGQNGLKCCVPCHPFFSWADSVTREAMLRENHCFLKGCSACMPYCKSVKDGEACFSGNSRHCQPGNNACTTPNVPTKVFAHGSQGFRARNRGYRTPRTAACTALAW
jgi:hypothetical protein